MKQREDFVSNSSSSSFIVLHRDNKFRILLHNPTVLSLRDYVYKFMSREVFPDYFFRKSPVMEFVSPEKFEKLFAEGKRLENVLPATARDLVDAYEKLKSETDEMHPTNEQYTAIVRAKHDIKDQIMEEVYKALELKWKDEKFDYEEIDDNNVAECYDDDKPDEAELEYVSGEEYVKDRIEYVSNFKSIKFFKTFSNH